MLSLTIGGQEYFDEEANRFRSFPKRTVKLEHSLKSLARWESKWKVPFLESKKLTNEQSIDYVRCMEITGNVDPEIFSAITPEQMNQIDAYISDNMTAATINRRGPKKPSSEKTTAETIYFWMIQLGIPPEYEKWHLSRLLTLIEFCSIKSGPQQKMSRQEQMAQQRAINNARRSKLHSRG